MWDIQRFGSLIGEVAASTGVPLKYWEHDMMVDRMHIFTATKNVIIGIDGTDIQLWQSGERDDAWLRQRIISEVLMASNQRDIIRDRLVEKAAMEQAVIDRVSKAMDEKYGQIIEDLAAKGYGAKITHCLIAWQPGDWESRVILFEGIEGTCNQELRFLRRHPELVLADRAWKKPVARVFPIGWVPDPDPTRKPATVSLNPDVHWTEDNEIERHEARLRELQAEAREKERCQVTIDPECVG